MVKLKVPYYKLLDRKSQLPEYINVRVGTLVHRGVGCSAEKYAHERGHEVIESVHVFSCMLCNAASKICAIPQRRENQHNTAHTQKKNNKGVMWKLRALPVS